MVEDIFNSRVSNNVYPNSRRIEVVEFKEPIEELIFSLKKTIEEYNNKTESNYTLKILDHNREVGNII